ncbi:hypothetical protein K8R03_03245 [Candidatus Kaiserbacteria bacterium]|nr:hypothetical protein [Candidatus Kaiserbacteria bacterium]
MADSISKDLLLSNIASVNAESPSGALVELRAIANMIERVMHKLPAVDLHEVHEKFSAAFKPLGEKPCWARALCRTLDNIEMGLFAGTNPVIATLPHTEFTPHPALDQA